MLITPNRFTSLSIPEIAFLLTLGIAIITFASLLIKYRHIKEYNSKLAWYRAGIYFCLCFILSWATGVLQTILSTPLFTQNQVDTPTWIGLTISCVLVEILAYGIIWPKGTLTHGRKLDWVSVLIFGFLWGISEGQLFLVFWALIERTSLNIIWVGFLTFMVISTFNGLWHSLYWDIKVAPEHNIESWNLKKVLLAHIPNLAVTLTYLAIYKNLGIFVLLQTLSLLLSTYFMRFPSPNSDNSLGIR